MTTVRLTWLRPLAPDRLFWQGEGTDVETGEVVSFGGIRDWAGPIAARFARTSELEVVVEPEGLVLERRAP